MTKQDLQDSVVKQPDFPAYGGYDITPDDDQDLMPATTALYIGVTGDVTVQMLIGDATITFTAVPVGILPIRVSRVFATGTSATDIIGLYV